MKPPAASVQYPPVRGDIAVVGVACTYGGARKAADFWQNIVNKVDAITDVFPARWNPDIFYDPDPNKEDRLYSKKGGWIPETYSFNPTKFGIPPASILGAEPDQCFLIRCVFEALEDAGYVNRAYDKERVSVIIGRGNYVGPGLMWLTMRTAVTEMFLHIARQMRPDLNEAQIERLKGWMHAKMPRLTPEAAGGLVPNISTGRVANRFDFMGRNYTVDAACASALMATEIACRNLITGVDDMTIIGGMHIFNNLPFLSVFKVARATSLTSTMRPFDAKADGTMCGEGVGTLVLKRLADAERDGDRIYAVIKGVGAASDGKAKAVMAPRVEGEVVAIERAFDMAQVPPQSIELVECHGTATVVGDATELEAMERVYGPSSVGRRTCAIGSVKSMIGHAMPASGAASLIKTSLALYHRVLPPTLNVTEPHPMLNKPGSRFYVNTEARPWIHDKSAGPRRAAVSAFGFGGINGHVVLEEYIPADESKLPTHLRDWDAEVVVIGAASRAALVEALDRVRAYAIEVEGVPLRDLAFTLNSALQERGAEAGLHRVAIVAATMEELAQKIDRARQRLADPECAQIRERGGLYYFDSPELRTGKVAFLFPGEGSQYLNMLSDLCMHFPEVRNCFDIAAAEAAGSGRAPLSALIFPPPAFSEEEEMAAEKELWSIERATESVLTAGGAMFTLATRLGLKADMMTGHSAGEWLAMAASGMIEIPEFIASMDRLESMYHKVAESTSVPRMAMLAVGAGREKILELAAEVDCEVHIANDNCPHQVVAVVEPPQADMLSDHLLKNGVFVERLPYDRGYHTPSFTYICDPLREFFRELNLQPPKLPVYSCTTTEPYPAGQPETLELVANTFARPLLFRQTIEKMYEAGARIFVECGPRGNLTAFVDDVLRGRPHLAVPLDQFRRPGLLSLSHAVALLAAAAVPVNFAPLYERRGVRKLTLDAKADSVLPEERQPGMMQISTCYAQLEAPPPGEFPMPSASDGEPSARPAPAVPAARSAAPVPAPAAARPAASAPAAAAAPVMVAPMMEMEEEPALAPVALAPVYSPVPAPVASVAPAVLADHFALMEEFLNTEEGIMSQMLGGQVAFPPAPAAPAEAWFAPAGLTGGSTQESGAGASACQPASSTLAIAPAVHPPAPVSLAPAAAPPAPVKPGLRSALLRVVSERTGYPEEMLDFDQDMEADLGIDSIKRVEIFGALRDLSGDGALSGEGDMEAVAKLKTLNQVLAFLEDRMASAGAPASAPALPAGAFGPWIHTAAIAEQTPDSLVLKLTLDLAEHKYLRDHSLYYPSTERDNQGDRIFVMPLTGSIELMCEAAARLDPGSKVVAVRNMQTLRPLAVVENQVPTRVQLVAKRKGPGEISMKVQEDKPNGSAYSQCTVVLAAAYLPAPALMDLQLVNSRAAECPGKDVYAKHRMFHGPAFQGIRTIESVADNGLLATLDILPNGGLVASDGNPQYHIDPHLLDAAGQLVGYWPLEFLPQGYVVLPIKIGEVAKYCDNPPPGSVVQCRLHVRDVGQRTLAANYDLILGDGRLWMRVTGWEDWRFYWPPRAYDFWRFPKQHLASAAVEIPALEKAGYRCCFQTTAADHERDALSDEIWTRVLLDRSELDQYQALPAELRTEWLFTRTVAKDAVRGWTERYRNRQLFPADIHLQDQPDGSFLASGFWTEEFAPPTAVTCFHRGSAIAVAGRERAEVAALAAGEALPEDGFLPEEIEWLDRMPDPAEWKARAIAGKQAAARFLRSGAGGDFWRSLIITKIDAPLESLEIADPGSAVNAEDAVTVATGRHESLIFAVAFR
jgi:acyl transferase domain-containing protein/acyl carrier protein